VSGAACDITDLSQLIMSTPKCAKSNSDGVVNSSDEFFPGISKIVFNPTAPPSETLVFRHYNAEEKILGRSMADWLRFAVCYWHTFRGVGLEIFGAPTIQRSWDDGSSTMENAKRRLRAAFEFMSKLGVRYWTFHDRDIAPEGADLAETNRNLDEITDLALELQQQTGIKCLWGSTATMTDHTTGRTEQGRLRIVLIVVQLTMHCLVLCCMLSVRPTYSLILVTQMAPRPTPTRTCSHTPALK
jgi:hypothetical protein